MPNTEPAGLVAPQLYACRDALENLQRELCKDKVSDNECRLVTDTKAALALLRADPAAIRPAVELPLALRRVEEYCDLHPLHCGHAVGADLDMPDDQTAYMLRVQFQSVVASALAERLFRCLPHRIQPKSAPAVSSNPEESGSLARKADTLLNEAGFTSTGLEATPDNLRKIASENRYWSSGRGKRRGSGDRKSNG